MNKLRKNTRAEIVIHLLVWIMLLVFPYSFTVGLGRGWGELIIHFWLLLFLLGVVFYFNYCFAVKQFLFGKSRWTFLGTNLLLIVSFIWLQHLLVSSYFQFDNSSNHQDRPPIAGHYYINFLIFIIPIAFAIAVQTGKRLLKVEMQQKEMDNINLQSELQLLKYQLQPHFFFNSLNNIYALVDTAPDKAKQTLHSLSKLMRHLLKSSEAEKVPLVDEVTFLNQYIALMALRQNANTKVEIHFPVVIPNIHVAPLLFVSIVENAFKHGVSATKPSWLYFELTISDDKQITFVSKNYNFPKDKSDISGSGIGIENLKKRLMLLYNNQHSFLIESDSHQFAVTLSFQAT